MSGGVTGKAGDGLPMSIARPLPGERWPATGLAVLRRGLSGLLDSMPRRLPSTRNAASSRTKPGGMEQVEQPVQLRQMPIQAACQPGFAHAIGARGGELRGAATESGGGRQRSFSGCPGAQAWNGPVEFRLQPGLVLEPD